MPDKPDRELVLPLDAAQAAPDPREGSPLFIGTATVLFRLGGFTVLTDPNFPHRHGVVRLGYAPRSKRLTEPAMQLADLPPIDLVVLSHFHEDHFDREVERDLDKAIPIETDEHGAHARKRRGFTAVQTIDVREPLRVVKGPSRLQITVTPGNHGPELFGKLLPPVMGGVL